MPIVGMFDEIKDKATELIKGNADKVDDAIDKAGDAVDEKTGGQYADKVDMAQEKAKEAVEGLSTEG
ncbi:MAG: antitoxin [Dermatophilaceae bacterium]